jgi:hypothetical protein
MRLACQLLRYLIRKTTVLTQWAAGGCRRSPKAALAKGPLCRGLSIDGARAPRWQRRSPTAPLFRWRLLFSQSPIVARGWATTRLERKISRPHVSSTLRPLETRLMIFHSNELLERRAIMGQKLFKGDFKNARSSTLQRLQAVDQ